MNKTGSKILHGMLLATSAMVGSTVIVSTAAMANPAGGTVAVGSATITNPSANQTIINQSSKKALINWNNFNIGTGQSVTFNQPNAKSLTVNRVTGPGSSTIDGSLFANGNIWLLNANGILFGKGSQINVGSLMATTSELSDADFKAGNNNFTASPNPNASVINQGTINVSRGGSVVLSAPRVSNEGLIQADLGTVVLGGAQAFTVDMTGDNLLRYEITAPVAQTPKDSNGNTATALVSNSGTIAAAGGHVLMTARAARNVENSVINNTGMVEATSVSVHDGEVDIDAGDGTANVGGTVDVSGNGAGQTGGTVTATGATVNVADGAKINASGSAGGGTVLIGGGSHGTGTLAHAQRTIIGAATINADATTKGNGGNVTVWSDGTTQFNGSISARGGAQGGNGGQIETSGHNLGVSSAAKVDTSAPLGLTGDWLLDPDFINIFSGAPDPVNSPNSSANISNATIGAALGSSNVTLEANISLNVSTNSSIVWNSTNTLSLLSEGNISVRSSIQNNGTGGINIIAGWDGSSGVNLTQAYGSQSVNVSAITANGAFGNSCGSVSISPGAAIAIGSAGGQTTIAGDDITVTSNGGANIQIGYGAGIGGGNIVVDAKGNLTLNGSGSNFLIGNGGIFACTSSPVTGDVTLNVGGNLTVNASNFANVSIGDGDIGGTLNGTVSGNVSVKVGGLTTLNNGNGTLTIGLSSGSSRSGNVSIITGSLSETGTVLEGNVITDLSGGNVFLGTSNASFDLGLGAIEANAAHNLTIASAGNLSANNNITNDGSGSIALIGGWNGNATNFAGLAFNATSYGQGATGEVFVNGNVSVGSAAGTTLVAGSNVTVSDGQIGYNDANGVSGTGDITVYANTQFVDLYGNGHGAQIGHGGTNSNGTNSGNITVEVANTGFLLLEGQTGSAQIGHGGAGSDGTSSQTNSGNINITSSSVQLSSGNVSDAFAQVGHGGANTTASASGNITLHTSGNVSILANGSYAQIGNGGHDAEGTYSGGVNITSTGGDVVLSGGSNITSYAQIGDGGYSDARTTVNSFGEILINAVNVSLTANSGYAQIGMGGPNNQGSAGYDDAADAQYGITINATGAVSLTADDSGGYAQIGSEGFDGSNIAINAAALNLKTANGGSVQIGNGVTDFGGQVSGGDVSTTISATVSGATTITGDGNIDIGNVDPISGSFLYAAVTLITGTLSETGTPLEDNLFGDLQYADVTLGFTNSSYTFASPAGNNFTSAHDLTILTSGDLNVEDPIINDGSGNVTLVAGWDTANVTVANVTIGTANHTIASQFVASNGTGYDGTGNIVIGGASDLTDVAVGSESGLTTVAGKNVIVDSEGSDAHIGAIFPAAGGDIQVLTVADLKLTSNGTNARAIIGNILSNDLMAGNVTLDIGGNITLNNKGGDILVVSAHNLAINAPVTDISTGGGSFDTFEAGDTLTVGGAIDTGVITLVLEAGANASSSNPGGIVDTSDSLLTAGTIRLEDFKSGSASDAVGTSSHAIKVATDHLSVNASGDDIYITSPVGSFSIGDGFGGIDGANVTLSANGSITQTLGVTATNLKVSSNTSIALSEVTGDADGTDNAVTGNITLQSPGAITFFNDGDIHIAAVNNGSTGSAGVVAITAFNGNLTQTGIIKAASLSVATDDAVFDTCSGGCAPVNAYDVTLTNTGNNVTGTFSTLAYGNVSFTNAGSITLGDVNGGPNGGGFNTSAAINITSVNGDINDTGAVVGTNVTLHAHGNITQTGGLDGGTFNAVSTAGNITLLNDSDFTGKVNLSAANGSAKFGNNDNTTLGNVTAAGDVVVLSEGNLTVTTSITKTSGNITLVGGWDGHTIDPTLLKVSGAYGNSTGTLGDVYIGNGVSSGLISVGSQSGSTTVEGHAINVNATNGSQIGYHGAGGGNITVLGTGDVTVGGTNGQIGNGGLKGAIAGNVTGNIFINTTGFITVPSAANATWLGNVAKTGFVETGNVTVIAAGGSLTGPDLGADLGTSIGTGGDVFIGWTTASNVGGLTYNSPHTFSWVATGELDVSGDIENSGSGAINLVGGWNGDTNLAHLANATFYGQNSGDVVIGVACGTGNVHVGGAGLVTVEGNGVTLNTQGGIVQLGYTQNTGGGNIIINAKGALTLGNALNATGVAQIGNGLTLGHKSATGNITIDAGSVVIDNYNVSGCGTIVTVPFATWIAGNDANIIAETGGIGSSANPLVVALNTIAVPHAGPNDGHGADVYISSLGGGISIGNNGNGIQTNGGNLTLTAAGNITQTSSVFVSGSGGLATISTTAGSITLNKGGNYIDSVALSAPGDVTLYDGSGFSNISKALTVNSASAGGNLTLLTTGNLDVIGAAQANGSALAVAGWNGNLNVTTAATIAANNAFGANGSGIDIGDVSSLGGASFGGANGTTVYGGSVIVLSNRSAAQLGFDGASTGTITVKAVHDVQVIADDSCLDDCSAIIGNGDPSTLGAVGGNILITAGTNFTVAATGGEGGNTFAGIGNAGEGATVGGTINITAANGVSIESTDVGSSTAIGNAGYGNGTAVSGDITITANGADGISTGGEGFAQIGNFVDGNGASVGGNITVIANNGGIDLFGDDLFEDDAQPFIQIGNTGYGNGTHVSGNIIINADDGDLSLDEEADGGTVQIGHSGGGPNGTMGGNITVFTSGDVSIFSSGDGSFAQIGHGASENEGSVTGNINITASGDVVVNATANDSGAVIGGGNPENTGNVSTNVTIGAGGDVSLFGSRGIAEIGSVGEGSTVGGNINITAAGNVSLESEEFGSTQIGNAGNDTNVVVTGAISVTANGTDGVLLESDFESCGTSVQIGNYGLDDGAHVSGNITVIANHGGVELDGEGDFSFVQIGNAGSATTDPTVGGDIVVNALGGDVELDADGDTSTAQIGNTGFGEFNTLSGNITVTASGNVILDAEAGDASAQIGNGAFENNGTVSGNINVTAGAGITVSALNLDEEDSDPAYALIGNGDLTGESTGSVSGDINVRAGGTLTFDSVANIDGDNDSDDNIAWLGNIGGSNTGDIESGNVTVVANQEVDNDDAAFGQMIVADLGQSSSAGSGGNVFVGLTSSVGKIGGLTYDSPHTLSIATTGDLGITGDIQNAGNGALNLIGGWDGTTFTPTSLGNQNVFGHNGSVNIGGHGPAAVGSAHGATTVAGTNVTLNGTNGAVQIGYDDGGATGDIRVLATANISLDAGLSFAQIGNGGAGEDGAGTSGSDSGNITVTAAGAVNLSGGASDDAYAQIGHGGNNANNVPQHNFSYSGNINVTGASVNLTGGSGSESYVQIGHGGANVGNDPSAAVTETVSGNIVVAAKAGSVTLLAGAGNSYAQIGHGGAYNGIVFSNETGITPTSSRSGNITVSAIGGSVILTAAGTGNDQSDYAMIGHGGVSVTGNNTGDIKVTSDHNITLTAGTGQPNGFALQFVQIGNGIASGSPGLGHDSGNITVNATGNLSLLGSTSNSSGSDYIQIGNGSVMDLFVGGSGQATGNIAINVGGTTTIDSTVGASDVWIGNIAGSNGTESGSVTIFTGDLSIDDDNNNDSLKFVPADLSGGAFTLGVANVNSNFIFGGFDYASNYALTLLTAGSLTLAGDIQNSGTGNITVVTGWNPSVAPALVGSTAHAYGNHNGSLTIGGASAPGAASLGSAGGTTKVLTDNLTIDAVNGVAQLGYAGVGSGAIMVSALGDVLVETQGSEMALIGNGGSNATGAIGGTVTVNAGGNVTLNAGAAHSIAEIGNVGGAGSSQSGAITVTAGGALTVEAQASNTTAQIGNEALGVSGTRGNAGGDINVSAASVSLFANGASTAAVIGNGNPSYFNGNVSGNIAVHTGDLTMFSQDVPVGGGALAMIGERASGTVNTTVVVNATGNISLSAGTMGETIIGAMNGAAGGRGTITVVAGGTIDLAVDGYKGETFIGNNGSSPGGNLSVTAGGNITLTARNSGTAGITDLGTGDFSGNINVTSIGGDVTVEAQGDDTAALIGLAAGGNASGVVSVNGANVSVIASGADSLANIGGLEAFAGNLNVTVSVNATNVSAIASADGSLANIGLLAEAGAQVNGAVSVTAANTVNVTQSNNGTALIGSSAVTGGTFTGDTTVIGQTLIGLGNSAVNDLNGGNVTLESLGNGGLLLDGGGTANSAHDLIVASAGNIVITGTIENAGSGDITLIAGWKPSVALGSVANTAGAYGNNNGSVTIGGQGADAIAGSAIGSAHGTTEVLTDNLTLDGANGSAQLGYDGAGDGTIDVTALGNVNVELSSSRDGDLFARIGNGGASGSGTGTITVNAGAGVFMYAGVANGTAQIGNTGSSAGGNVSVSANGSLDIGANRPNAISIIGNTNSNGSQAGGAIDVSAVAFTVCGTAEVAGDTASIALSGAGNSVGLSYELLQVDVNDLTIQTNNGDAYISSPSQGLSIGVGGKGINLGTGNLVLTAGGDITQTAAVHATSLNVAASNGDIDLGNANNAFNDALVVASGNATLTDTHSLTVDGATVGGLITLTSGGSIGQTGAITAGDLAATALNGDIVLDNMDNVFTDPSLNASGNATLADSGNLTISGATVGGTLTLTSGGSIDQTGAISANTLVATASNGDITLTDTGNAINSATLFSSNNASLTDSTGLTIGGATVSGSLILISGGSINQSGAINGGLIASTSDGDITLTNSGNAIRGATLSASGNASLRDSTGLELNGADVGGTFTLTADGSVTQAPAAITAHNLVVSATNGDITLDGTANSIGSASLTASGNIFLRDAGDLVITGATAGNELALLIKGSITQTGAISAADLLVASQSDITLTNTKNAIKTASLTASGNATLVDASSLTITGAHVGGALTLVSSGSIGQTGAISAHNLVASTANGDIALTNANNVIADASLSASGNVSLYDNASLTLDPTAGGDVTVLATGDLNFVTSVQLQDGNLLAVAGWDGHTTGAAAASGSAYGNHGGSITIGGTGVDSGIAVGSKNGTTTLAGDDLLLSAINGYAQVGYHGGGGGAIVVNTTGDVTLNGGTGTAYFAQIGDGGYQVSGPNSGAVSVSAAGNVTLNAGSGQEAYAQIGNGGAESNSNSTGYNNTGAITVAGSTVALNAGSGNASYAQIGNGGYKSGQGLNGIATVGGNIQVNAVSAVNLNGNADDAFAQIGNGGDYINNGAADGSSGTINGTILVAVSNPDPAGNAVSLISGTGMNSYTQIGDGGDFENTPAAGATVSFTVGGDITIDDLLLTGSNAGGGNGYAQVGNGDAAGTGTGKASGTITIATGTTLDLTDGTAPDSPARIGNGPPTSTPSTTPTSDPTTGGTISTTIQNNNTPTTYIIADLVVIPSYPSTDTGTGPGETPPLEKLAGDGDEEVASDDVATSVSDLKGKTTSKTIIPGVLDEIVTLTPRNPHGIPPADEDYSSWGNEAFWRW